MGVIISILIFIVCVLLILVILVQNSKGGGLSSSFGSASPVMGVRKTADFLEKATWGLAISLLVLSLMSAGFSEKTTQVEQKSSVTEGLIKNNAPAFNENIPAATNSVAPTQSSTPPADGATTPE